MRVSVLVLAVLVACGKSKAECAAEVADLMQFLRSLNVKGSQFQVDAAKPLVTRTGLPEAKESAPNVVVDAKITSFQGRDVDRDGLATALVALQKRIREQIASGRIPKKSLPDPRLLYFQISADASWESVVAAVQAGADAGFTRAGFVFLAPAVAVKPPPRTWVDEEAEKPGSKDVSQLVRISDDITKSCPAVKESYGSVSPDEGDKAESLLAGTERGLIDCNCKVDMPALRSMWWQLLGSPRPTGIVEIVIDKAGGSIELAAATPWRDASEKIVPGTSWLATSR